MPFVKCPECGKLNSVKLKICPKCEASLEVARGGTQSPSSGFAATQGQIPVSAFGAVSQGQAPASPWGQALPPQPPQAPSSWGQTEQQPTQQGGWGQQQAQPQIPQQSPVNPWGQPVQQPTHQATPPTPPTGWGEAPQQAQSFQGWGQTAEQQPSQAASVWGQQAVPTMQVCAVCKSPVPMGATVCAKCGSPLPPQTPPAIPTRKNPYQR